MSKPNLLRKFLIIFALAFFVSFFSHSSFAASFPTEKQFTGHVFDQSSDLYYMRTRYYDPVIGRFLSPDITGDSPNRYAYVHNNPLAFIDPMGEQSRKIRDPIYEQWLFQNFPWALEQQSPLAFNYFDVKVLLLAGLGDQRYLDTMASQFIAGNPYNPVTQKKEFVGYLIQDIRKEVSYNQDFATALKLQEDAYEAMESMEAGQKGSQEYFRLLGQRARGFLLEWKESFEVALIPHTERIRQEKSFCFDYALFTAQVLARAGVPPAIGITPKFQGASIGHTLLVVNIDGEFYRVDPALRGLFIPFNPEEYPSEWEFVAPWGGEFEEFPFYNFFIEKESKP